MGLSGACLVLKYTIMNVWIGNLLKNQLADKDIWAKNQRNWTQIVKLQLQISFPAHLQCWGSNMDKKTESSQPTLAFDSTRKCIGQFDLFFGPPKYKFSRGNFEPAFIRNFRCLAICTDKLLPIDRICIYTYLNPDLPLLLDLSECNEFVA